MSVPASSVCLKYIWKDNITDIKPSWILQMSYGSPIYCNKLAQECSPYDKGRDNTRDVEWTQCHINLQTNAYILTRNVCRYLKLRLKESWIARHQTRSRMPHNCHAPRLLQLNENGDEIELH